MAGRRFDWDELNLPKCAARVARFDIEKLFQADETIIDPAPHPAELRYRAIGFDDDGRPMVVIFTIRVIGGRPHVRPISARYAHEKEVDRWPKRR